MSFKFKILIKTQPELKVCGVVTGGSGLDVCPPYSREDERQKESDTGTPPRGRRADSHSSVNKSGQRRPSTGAPQPKALSLPTALKANSAVSEPECK